VVATDNLSAPCRSSESETQKGVIQEEALESIRKYPDRMLLMVYPPLGPLCSRVLEAYRRDAFIYIGEGLAGVNADEAFFCELRRNWNIRKVVELPPWIDSYEKAYFLERRKET